MYLNRPWHAWLVFGACLVVVLAATGWITVVAVRLDRKDAADQRAAELEENVRLALWRMDSALTPLIAEETARPVAHFTTYYPVAGAFNRAYLAIQDGQVFAPSPLVAFRSPYVRLHFQLGPDGTLTSPQVPTGATLEALRARFGDAVQPEASGSSLARLCTLFESHPIAASLPRLDDDPFASVEASTPYLLCSPSTSLSDASARSSGGVASSDGPAKQEPANEGLAQSVPPGPSKEFGRSRNEPGQQALRSSIEQSKRMKQTEFSNQLAGESNPTIPLQSRGAAKPEQPPLDSSRSVPLLWQDVRVGGFRLSWHGDELLLMRRVATAEGEYVQGCWFDWPEMRQWFLDQISDLLPQAALTSAVDWSAAAGAATTTTAQTRLLAAAPVRLIPGALPATDTVLATPTRHSIVVGWFCVFLAVVAVAVLLKGTLALSERRADFVSAVTHELRTPLTTFRMYTQMLAGGMIRDDQKRSQYIETLRRESDRLGHLVENVLSYARLERGRPNGCVEEITLGQILDRVLDRLRERAELSGMSLDVSASEPTRNVVLQSDATAVGQILFNLVDNACKYACSSATPAISITADHIDHSVKIRVHDHGPGISPSVARSLFQPFRKSAETAAQTAPGVGLGLALSRRLARHLRGDLTLESDRIQGSTFVLTLPDWPQLVAGSSRTRQS